MKRLHLTKFRIQHYRSIEDVEITMPEKAPLVLFGPNNAGKSNILSGIDRLLGERYPTYIEMLDSDYFQRDKVTYPTTTISAEFSKVYYCDKFRRPYFQVALTYGVNGNTTENLLHDGLGNRLYMTNEDRSVCQSFLINAERNIQSAFNYSSKYSLLSKFSHHIHTALTTKHKEELTEAFQRIKASFEESQEFKDFFEDFASSLKGAVKGFVHSLEVDFSAYDPNNYAKSMRIYAKEGDNVRSFEEFGTGEQQVLLMAFVKAYMRVFSSENFILIIEEPEAHLHPLAQKWLKEYIFEMCNSGIQVIISTHSTAFITPEHLNSLVRVYKENNITKVKQLSKEELCNFCIETGVPSTRISQDNVEEFYAIRLFTDQLYGMFAETILLVEGQTEFFAIPEYLKRLGFSLPEHGIEIINCNGKNTIPLLWRIFTAFGYNCYFIFDGDSKTEENSNIFTGILNIDDWEVAPEKYVILDKCAYFGKDFESYFRSAIPKYSEKEKDFVENYHIISKQGKAKAIAQNIDDIPDFIKELKDKLEKF